MKIKITHHNTESKRMVHLLKLHKDAIGLKTKVGYHCQVFLEYKEGNEIFHSACSP